MQVTGGSARANGCGTWSASATTGKPLGSSGVVIDGLAHDGTLLDGSLAGRIYHGVAVRGDGSFVTAAVNGTISSFTAAGAVDTGFGTRRHDDDPGVPRCTPCACTPTAASWRPASARGTGSAKRLLVAKLGPGGAPSAGFGTAGVVRLLAGTGNNQGQALALQSDGRILIAGGAVTSGNVSSFAVARLTAAGGPIPPGRPAAWSRPRSARPARPRRSSRRRAGSSSPGAAPTARSATPISMSSSRATSAGHNP